MRAPGLVFVLSLIAGCSNSAPPAPRNTTPAAPAKIEIPQAPEQPISALEKNNKSFSGDLDAIMTRGYLRILVAPSRTYFQTVDGKHQGLAVDAGVELAKKMTEVAGHAITPVFIETRDDQLIPALL